jgi:hypothetical protein
MAGHVDIADIRSGLIDLGDILKLNALMDAQLAAEERAARKTK